MHTNQLLSNNSNNATMSSLDFLAEVINPARVEFEESEHEPRKFLAKVEDELDLCPTGKKFRLNSNQTRSYYYELTKEQMMLVGMRESKAVRRKVIEWIKAQNQSALLPNFSNPAEAARAWADEVEAKQAAIALIEQQKPAVEFVDSYVSADSGSKGFRQVAKLLQANERQFREFLNAKKIMYRLGGEWMPYQNHVEAGRFEVKTGVAGEHVFNQAKFTAKGINWVAGVWAQHQLRIAA